MNILIIVGGIVLVVAILMGGFFWWRNRQLTDDPLGLAGMLADEKAKSEIILKAIDDGMVLIDHRQIIRHFNQAAADILGWKLNEAMGLDWRSVFRFIDDKGQNIADSEVPFNKVVSTGDSFRDSSLSVVTKSNKNIAVTFSVSPLLDEYEQVKGLVGIFRDISAEKQQESQRAEFISTASHEMRTPVAAIEGYLSLALNEKVATIDARARDYLEKAHSSTKHLGQLFQDLLTSARAEDGRLTSHPEVVEVGEYLERLAGDLSFAAKEKNLSMQFIFGGSSTSGSINTSNVVRPLYYIAVDPDRFREVVTNLFDNACKYTAQGSVTLGLTGDTDVVQVYLKDTGPGIPEEDLSHIFQKFYRVDNSSTRTVGGTGLGLYICRKIIELYEGRIWAESTLGDGSTFYINIPRISTQRAEQLQNTGIPIA